jgi:hypothetical protein
MTTKPKKWQTVPSCYSDGHLFTVGPPHVGKLWLCLRCGRLCAKESVPWYRGPRPPWWSEYTRPK